jgi:flagellar hook-associated protein 3 FlgL
MRLATNTVSDSIVRQIQLLNERQTKLQSQVGSGLRITQPEDDPVAMGRVLNNKSEQRRISQFATNADRAREISQATYAGLKSLKSLSDRATEIGTLASGTADAAEMHSYATEVNQLIEQGVQLANAQLNNDYLFAGTAVDTPPFAATRTVDGRVGSVSYAGNSQRAAVQLSEVSSLAPGADSATNTGLMDFINQLVALRDALEAADKPAATATLGSLVGSEDVLVAALAEQGAVQMRIDVSKAQQQSRADNLTELISADSDADLSTTVVQLSQAQTAYQAALQSAANIMRISLLDYIK